MFSFRSSPAITLILIFLIALALAPIVATSQNIQYGGNPSDSGPIVSKAGTATDTSAITMLPAPPTGVRNYVYQVQCVNNSASTVAVALIKDGSTVIGQVACPAAGAASAPIRFDPPLKQPTTGTALTMTSTASATTLYYYMSGRTAR